MKLLVALLLALNTPAVSDGWKITATDYAAKDYFSATVASGQIGIRPGREPFSIGGVVLNNVFDFDEGAGVNTVMPGPVPFGLSMKVDGKGEWDVTQWQQTVDMLRAEHSTTFVADGKVRVTYTVRALRNMPFCVTMDVRAEALKAVTLDFENAPALPGDWKNVRKTERKFRADAHPIELTRYDALTRSSRYRMSMAVMPVGLENGKSLKKGESLSFTLAASIVTSLQCSDTVSESERQVIYIATGGSDAIISAHRKAWEELWKGDIEIEGDLEAQRTVRLALFNLYGSIREGSGFSIPPMGLTSRGYSGHVFWDAEMWMYPVLLLLQPALADEMLRYRLDRVKGAAEKAKMYGYKGLMFPWESDWDGEESTPVWALTGPREHHITADIAIAVWNRYLLTSDKEFLLEYWPILEGVAQFWESRVAANPDGSYSILGVVGADENASNVDDNAFTNGAAIRALEAAVSAARILGKEAPESWRTIAAGIRIPVKDGVTMVYEGYDGRRCKQADPTLLSFPLGIVTDPARINADLAYYSTRIDVVNGPAMTWGMFAASYARLGNRTAADEFFRRSYRPNLRPPFGVMAETPTSRNPFFTTGAGAMLQAVLYGFAGCDIGPDGLTVGKGLLPPGWKLLTVKGVGPERRTVTVK